MLDERASETHCCERERGGNDRSAEFTFFALIRLERHNSIMKMFCFGKL